jgi:hypothetical protein
MSQSRGGSSTLRSILFPGSAANGLQEILEQADALEQVVAGLERVPAPLSRAAVGRIGAILADLLDVKVVDVLVDGWRKHATVMAAARETLHTPGEEQLIDLATHVITWKHEPSVQVIVNDVDVGSVGISINASATIHALVAVVGGGKLMSFRSGRVELMASVSCEGHVIQSMKREIDAALEFALDDGIVLVRPEYVVIPEPPVPLR